MDFSTDKTLPENENHTVSHKQEYL